MEQEQKQQLEIWSIQRDAVLLEISTNRILNEKLIQKNKELSNSNSEIETRMNQSIGRLQELKNKEKEMANSFF